MPIDWKVFHKNWSEFPLDKLEPYLGRWVAWNFTGDAIVAQSSVSEEDLREKLRASGANPNEYATSYVPGPGDVFDGAFIVSRGEDARPEAAPRISEDPNSIPSSNSCDSPTAG